MSKINVGKYILEEGKWYKITYSSFPGEKSVEVVKVVKDEGDPLRGLVGFCILDPWQGLFVDSKTNYTELPSTDKHITSLEELLLDEKIISLLYL